MTGLLNEWKQALAIANCHTASEETIAVPPVLLLLNVFKVGNIGFGSSWGFQTVLIDSSFIRFSFRELKELLGSLASFEEPPIGILR